MEVIKKPKPQKTLIHRWSEKALGVKRPGTPKSAVLNEYKFSDDFSPQRLKAIKEEADRGFFVTRLGSFKKVIEQAERTYESYTAFRGEKKEKKGKKTTVSPDEMSLQFEQLITSAQQWLQAFDEEGQREKTGVVSDTAKQADKHRQAKIRACQDMIAGARISIAQIRLMDLEEKDGDIERTSGLLRDLNTRISMLGAKREHIEEGRNLDAMLLSKVCGVKVPESGTSDVALIKAPDGTLAYAYKSIQGESDQTGLPKGAGAVREVLMSRLCERVKEDCGLDFKWPKASMGDMEIEGKKTSGVLIEGIKGREAFNLGAESNINLSREEFQKKSQEGRELLEKLPPEEIQQVALCNLAFGQYDMKWDNCFIQEDEEGGASCVPFDGGAAFPDLNLFMDTAMRGGVPGSALTSYGDDPLHCVVDGKKTEMGEVPMSPALVKKFKDMDGLALAKSAQVDLKELSEKGLDGKALGMETGVYIMGMSIKGMKDILDENPGITLTAFLNKYRTEVLLPLAEKLKPAWEEQVKSEYLALLKDHAGLLPPAEGQDAQNMRNRYLVPEQRMYLRQIMQLGGVDFLSRDIFKIKLPLANYLSPKSIMVDKLKKLTPANEQERYPEIFGKKKK